MVIDNAYWTLSDGEREASGGLRLAASHLLELLDEDNPMSRLEAQLESQKARTAELQHRLADAEAEVERFRDGVGRGWTVIVVGFLVTWWASPEMGWLRSNVVFVWLILAVCWFAIWGRSPIKESNRR